MGGPSWGTNHAFSLPENDAKDLNLTITISIGQSDYTLDYLEPVLVEYSLQNISRKPIELDHISTEYDQPVLSEEILDIFVRHEKSNVKDQTINKVINSRQHSVSHAASRAIQVHRF
ncbi:MAG: hypothetical protein AAGG59_14605 [Bacteroidota bacterium]